MTDVSKDEEMMGGPALLTMKAAPKKAAKKPAAKKPAKKPAKKKADAGAKRTISRRSAQS